ncbi:arylamine N-acetyltransferase [Amycolatopsis ultiminotia]|uniref:Arylamine N-acetyltransferase n=1 Tax=Amycolatopsis ultiminotia TaxID=543629 RepID=A0ABP6XJ56_9PSEU
MSLLHDYLGRIGFTGPVEPTLESLRALCRAHALAVPFDSLGAIDGRIRLDEDLLIDKLVTHRKGGACFENHTLFARVLREIGFTTTVAGAYMWRPQHREYSSVLAHMLLVVRLDGQDWLVDVSFSHDTFIEPLPFDEQPHEQRGWVFQATRRGVDWVMSRRGNDGVAVPLYRFHPRARPVEEFQSALDYLASPGSRSQVMSTLICARTLPAGKLTLINKILVTARPGEEHTRKITGAEHAREVLERIFDGHPAQAQRALEIWRARFDRAEPTTPDPAVETAPTEFEKSANW